MKPPIMNIVLLLFILFSGCKENSKTPQEVKIQSNQKKITVTLAVEDSVVSMNNAFRILISNGDWSSNVAIEGNEIHLPELKQDTGYLITFTYKSILLSFKGITKKRMLGDQAMKWEFGIDSLPFNKALSLVPPKELEAGNTVKKVEYLIFDPQENGIGVAVVNKIN